VSTALWQFPGGLVLPAHKAGSTAAPAQAAPIPDRLTVPIAEHPGEAAEVLVTPGDTVRTGQLIAHPKGQRGAAVHAPASGRVAAVEERRVPHPSGLAAPCVVIDSDGEDRWVEPAAPLSDVATTDPASLIRRIRDCGIVGLGGATFPTAEKLESAPPATGIEMLILNGAECEPYISCDNRLMRERPGAVIDGAWILMRVLMAPRCLIGVEDNKPEAIAALEAAVAEAGFEGVGVVTVPTRYPVGGEKQLVYTLTGKVIPSGALPAAVGVISQNVATAAAVHDAVRGGRPLIERYVTVTGPGVAQPRNVVARLGTPIEALIRLCGGYAENASRLIMGGPMMGFAIDDDTVPIVKGSNCLLVGTAETFPPPQQALPCIRCGACADACPVALLPQQLYWHARAGELDRACEYHLDDCIECGICGYVCPSHIPLVQYFLYAKSEIAAREQQRRQAELARTRYEQRQQRLERDRLERASARQRKKAVLQHKSRSTEQKKAEIQAALERARRKKSDTPGSGGRSDKR